MKNAFLDFSIPYTEAKGDDRQRRDDQPHPRNHRHEARQGGKAEKKWTVENRWLPAVNAIRAKHGWDRWDFIEIAEDIRDARNLLLAKLESSHGPPSLSP